jgi:hypothetical protein
MLLFLKRNENCSPSRIHFFRIFTARICCVNLLTIERRRSIAHNSDDSEYEEPLSLHGATNETENSSFVDRFLHELNEEVEPVLIDDDDSDVPHMLAGAESEKYDNLHFGFEYLTLEPKVCVSSDTEKQSLLLDGAERWADLSEDLLSFRPEPACEDIFKT